MTTETQKRHELRVLLEYLGTTQRIGCINDGAEPPDFLVNFPDRTLAVEVTEYHRPRDGRERFTVREVEATWDQVRDCARGYCAVGWDEGYLSVWLELRQRRLPPRSEVSSFVKAVRDLIRQNRHLITRDPLYMDVCDSDSKLLASYLSTIRVRKARTYMEWDWNFSAGSVGTSDEEILSSLKGKLEGYRPVAGVDANVLLVSGWHGRMSQIIAPWLDRFRNYRALNTALAAGPFDEVAILCFTDRRLRWTRSEGWQSLHEGCAAGFD